MTSCVAALLEYGGHYKVVIIIVFICKSTHNFTLACTLKLAYDKICYNSASVLLASNVGTMPIYFITGKVQV